MENLAECAGTPRPKSASASPWCPEDSGYCTITPSSADSAHQYMVHNSIENIDPNTTAPYFYPHLYIDERQQISTLDTSTTAIIQFSTSVTQSSTPGVHSDRFSHSYKPTCSTTTELSHYANHSNSNDMNIGSGSVRRPLKRQRQIEETELQPEEFLTSGVFKEYGDKKTDISVSEQLRCLTVNDEPNRRKSRPKRARTIGQLTKTASYSTPKLQEAHTYIGHLDTSDYLSRSHVTLEDSAKQALLLYPTTPVKSSSRTIMNLSPKFMFCDRLQRTPEKDRVDLQFADEYLQLEGRFAKRLNFAAPLGSPEKNKILYPILKPVTPPKKDKTPDKCMKSPKGIVKCKRLLIRRSLCGLEKVDFLKMLGEQQDHWPAVQRILTYLNGEDVCRMCLVSQTWRKICQLDHKANRRRKTYIDLRRTTKENFNSTVVPKNKLLHSKSYDCTRSLKDIRNNTNIMQVSEISNKALTSPPVSPSSRRYKMFLKAGSHDHSLLTKCTRCRGPALVSNLWAQCQNRACAFTFCRRCLNAPHSGPCARQLEAPSPSKPVHNCATVATAKSRGNLRRLLNTSPAKPRSQKKLFTPKNNSRLQS